MSRHGSASPPSFGVAFPPRRQPSRFCSNHPQSRPTPNIGGGARSAGSGRGGGERLYRDDFIGSGGGGRRGPTDGWRGGVHRQHIEPSSRRNRPTEQHRQWNDRDGGRGEGGGRGGGGVGGREPGLRGSPRRQTSSRTTPRVPRRSGTNRDPIRSTFSSHNYLREAFDSSSDFEDLDILQLGGQEADSFEDELMQELQASRGGLGSGDLYGLIDFMNLSSVDSTYRRPIAGSTSVPSGDREGGNGRLPRNRPSPRSGSTSVNNSNSSSRVRGVSVRTVRLPGQADSSSNATSTNRRNRGRRQGPESTRDSPQPQREQRRRQQRIGGNVVSLPASLRSFLLYGIDDLWPEEFDQEFFLGDQSELHNSGLHFLPTADAASVNNLPPTPRVAEGENCQREKLKDELNSNTAECVICTDLLGATEQVWPCKNCYNIFHLYCIRRWAKTNLDTEIVGAWICPVCRRPKYITPNRLRYRCLCGRLPKPRPLDGVTPHCCGKMCIRRCSHLCHPGPCRPPQPPDDEQQQPVEKQNTTS